MTETSLKTFIETTLNIPVFDGADSIVYPSATFEINGHPALLVGEGKAVIRGAEATINIWCEEKAERDAKTTLLLDALDAGNSISSVPDCSTFYDTTAKKFRSVISFNFIPREET